MKVLWLLLCALALTAAQEDAHHHEEELRINGVEDVAHTKSEEEIAAKKEESPVTSGLRTLLDNSPFFARIFKLVTGDEEDASPGRTFFGQDGQVPGNLLQMFFNNPLVQSNPIIGGLLNAFVPSQASGRLLQAAAEGANAVAPAAPDVLGLLGLGGGGGGGLAGIDGILGALFDLFGQNPLLGDLFTQTTGYNVQTLLGNKITLVREVFCVFFTSEAVSGDLVLSQLFAPFLQLFGVFFGESCTTQEEPVTEAVPVVPVAPPVVKPVVFKRPQVIIQRVPYPVYRPYPVYYTRPVVYRPRPYRYYVRYGGPRRYYGHRRYGSYGGHRRRYKNKINKKW